MEQFQRNRTEMVNTSFEALPIEIQTEIMSRLPLKALMICICTSKKWASLIRTKAFTDLYLQRSTTRPRVMFLVFQTLFNPIRDEVLFQSVYQEEEPLLSSGQQQVRFEQRGYEPSQPVQGLICLYKKNREVMIFNPGTNKSLPLPVIPVPKKRAPITIFFGYDRVTDVYKVLCIADCETRRRSKVTKEQHIFTMGSNEAAWRRITCEHQHSPAINGQGPCIEGVLYYRARSSNGKGLVMSFNVRSEEFGVIELHEDVNIEHAWDLMNYNNERGWELVNYNGAVALVDDSDFSHGVVNELNGSKVFHIWVMNKTTRTWSKDPIEIPRWRETVENPKVYFFRGTTRTGKLVFTVKHFLPKIDGKRTLFVVYYDPDTRDIRRFKVEGGDEGHCVRFYLDHVDTPMII